MSLGSGIKSIDTGVFEYCFALQTLTFGEIEAVGDIAFSNCTSLESINIPEGVVSIGSNAFYNCRSLKSIHVPKSVTTIGSYALLGCTSLESITVDAENTVYSSDAGDLYTEDGTTLIQYAIGKTVETFAMPNTVTKIGSSAFFGCTNLTGVTISSNVTSIGSSAFAGCSNLTSITIPRKVDFISNYAFKDCDSLASIVFIANSGWVMLVESATLEDCEEIGFTPQDISNSERMATEYFTNENYMQYSWKRR